MPNSTTSSIRVTWTADSTEHSGGFKSAAHLILITEMVGPTRAEIEEPNDYGWIKWGFVVLIALSGGLTAVYADASLAAIALSTLVGALVGAALMQYLFWMLTG